MLINNVFFILIDIYIELDLIGREILFIIANMVYQDLVYIRTSRTFPLTIIYKSQLYNYNIN